MSKKFVLLFIVCFTIFSVACQQQNPTPIQSTYQPRDTNRPIATHSETNHENKGNSMNQEMTNSDMMNANTMNANTSMSNANMTYQTESKPESRTNSGR